MKSRILSIVALSIVSLLLSCGRSIVSDSVSPFPVSPPHVTVIYVTDEQGNLRRTIGQPAAMGAAGGLVPSLGMGAARRPVPSNWRAYAYPNPFNPSTRVQFDLPVASQYTIQVVRAVGPGDEPTETGQIHLGSAKLPEGFEVMHMYSGSADAGVTALVVSATYDDGRPWLEGYYRVYIRFSNGPLLWVDLLLIWDPWHSKYRALLRPFMPGG